MLLLIVPLAICIANWCYPWNSLATPRGIIALQLPWLAIPVCVLYEILMRRSYNIRVDLVILGPLAVLVALVTLVLYIVRMTRIVRCRRELNRGRGFDVVKPKN